MKHKVVIRQDAYRVTRIFIDDVEQHRVLSYNITQEAALQPVVLIIKQNEGSWCSTNHAVNGPFWPETTRILEIETLTVTTGD